MFPPLPVFMRFCTPRERILRVVSSRTDGRRAEQAIFFFFRVRRLSFFLLFFQVDPGPRTSSRSRRAAQSWLTATWTSKLGLSSSALSRARHGRVPRYVIITSSLAVLLRYTSLHVDTQMLAKVLSIVSGPTTCPRRTLDVPSTCASATAFSFLIAAVGLLAASCFRLGWVSRIMTA
jgi:hypothetical protein